MLEASNLTCLQVQEGASRINLPTGISEGEGLDDDQEGDTNLPINSLCILKWLPIVLSVEGRVAVKFCPWLIQKLTKNVLTLGQADQTLILVE